MDPTPHSARSYWIATIIMLALAGTSLVLSHAGLGMLGTFLVFGIAFAMAAIIAVMFFGLGRQPGSNRLVLLTASALVLILVLFMTADVLLR